MRLILLDRDGVINVDRGYVSTPDRWQWCPGAREALLQLKRAGYETVIVTNQSGVGRGQFTEDDFYELMTWAKGEFFWYFFTKNKYLNSVGGSFPCLTAVCFHSPDDHCDCRKPKTGLWRKIENTFVKQIDLSQSWFVDDKFENLEFGREIGLNLAWVTQDSDNVREPLDYEPFGSLHHFAEYLLGTKIT